MKEEVTKSFKKEWGEFVRNHPDLCRAFISQQLILVEASKLGVNTINERMCELMRAGVPVLFSKYWMSVCNKVNPVNDLLECLRKSNDPSECLSSGPGEPPDLDPLPHWPPINPYK